MLKEEPMLDRLAMELVKPHLAKGALLLHQKGIKADQVTITGFLTGMLCLPLLYLDLYIPAMLCIVLNRTADGLDGAVARLSGSTDGGGYLDITLDFIFYSAVVFGFALASPESNSLAAAALIFSFIGSGCSFLAFGIMAERKNIVNRRYPNKGFYYVDGLAEGTETIIFLLLFCLFPGHFASLAWFLRHCAFFQPP